MLNRKIIREKQAKEWTEKMQQDYAEEIQQCIRNTIVYDGNIDVEREDETSGKKDTVLFATDTVSALFDIDDSCGKTAVLNFASYKHPGGGFIRGSMAQEEALCHESFLYNVLNEFDTTFYEYNRMHSQHKGLYSDRMLYTPDVRFFHNGKTKTADVITCAAPNRSVGQKYGNVSEEENRNALSKRITFIFDAAEASHVDTLILGAYGCGVFRQNPKEVACAFRILSRGKYHFKNLIFAVPDETSDNYTQMKKWL